MNTDDVLLICHTCGERVVVEAENWEAQRTFRKNHAWPCPYGSLGKRWTSDRSYEIGNGR